MAVVAITSNGQNYYFCTNLIEMFARLAEHTQTFNLLAIQGFTVHGNTENQRSTLV